MRIERLNTHKHILHALVCVPHSKACTHIVVFTIMKILISVEQTGFLQRVQCETLVTDSFGGIHQ